MKNRRISLLVIFGFINLCQLLSQTPPPPNNSASDAFGSPIEGGLLYLIISVIIYSAVNIGYIKKSLFKSKKIN